MGDSNGNKKTAYWYWLSLYCCYRRMRNSVTYCCRDFVVNRRKAPLPNRMALLWQLSQQTTLWRITFTNCRQMHGRMDARRYGRTGAWTHGRTDARTHGHTDARTYRLWQDTLTTDYVSLNQYFETESARPVISSLTRPSGLVKDAVFLKPSIIKRQNGDLGSCLYEGVRCR